MSPRPGDKTYYLAKIGFNDFFLLLVTSPYSYGYIFKTLNSFNILLVTSVESTYTYKELEFYPYSHEEEAAM